MISTLVPEIKLLIVSYLPWDSLLSLRCTSKQWYELVDSHGVLYTSGSEDLVHRYLLISLEDAQKKDEKLLETYTKAAAGFFGDEDGTNSEGGVNLFGTLTPVIPGVTKVHGVLERFCVADPGWDAMMEVNGVEFRRRLARFDDGDNDGEEEEEEEEDEDDEDDEDQEDEDEGKHEQNDEDNNAEEVQQDEEEEEDEEDEDEEGVYMIPFADSPLLYPPVKGPVPCRVRYNIGVYQLEGQHNFLITHRARTDDGENGRENDYGYVTVLDACTSVKKYLGPYLKWEATSLMVISRVIPYVNPHGWLDIAFGVLRGDSKRPGHRPAPKKYPGSYKENWNNYSGLWNPVNKGVDRNDFAEEPGYVHANWFNAGAADGNEGDDADGEGDGGEDDENLKGLGAYYAGADVYGFATDEGFASGTPEREEYYKGLVGEMYRWYREGEGPISS